jgi:predicted phosphoribosyltransferase
LAQRLSHYAGRNDVTALALPRGGVPIAYEIAKAVGARLDVFLVRKVGVPQIPELGMGAIASGGVRRINAGLAKEFALSDEQVTGAIERSEREMARQEAEYRGARPQADLRERTVILVDDGIATGHTMLAAIEAARQLGAIKVVIAAGVAPVSTYEELKKEADEVVCLIVAADFRAVGMYYEDFSEVSDEEVKRLLSAGNGVEKQIPHAPHSGGSE